MISISFSEHIYEYDKLQRAQSNPRPLRYQKFYYLYFEVNEFVDLSYHEFLLRCDTKIIPAAAKTKLATRLRIKHFNGHFIWILTTQIQQAWLEGEKFFSFLFPSIVTEFLKFHFIFCMTPSWSSALNQWLAVALQKWVSFNLS